MVVTLSQSYYRWGPSANQITGMHAGVVCKGCTQGLHVQGLCTRVACTGVVHKGCTQGLRMQGFCTRVVCTGVPCKGCACRGCMRKGGGDTQPIRLHRDCMQALRAQGWRGHSANQITQGLRKRIVHARVACKGCTCRGGGDTQPIRLHRDCMQGLHAQGLCTGVACARVACTGVACKGCVCRGCTQGLHVQGLRTGVACRGCMQGLHIRVECKGVAHTRVVGTLSQSGGCARKGGGDTQPIRLHRGCTQGLHV